jgi:hypothetical protein
MTKEVERGKNPNLDYEGSALKLADGVINKPFDIKKVLETIKQYGN